MKKLKLHEEREFFKPFNSFELTIFGIKNTVKRIKNFKVNNFI